MTSIGEPTVAAPYSIRNLPPIFIGGSVFNYQYCSNPLSLPVAEVVEKAFSLGLNAIDTSPYYGPSESLLGKALAESSFQRDQYYICTKAGRIQLDEFDYSHESVRSSVERSLERLNTDYLDLVYMHDIEFVDTEDIFLALREMKKLKLEGKVRNIGVSGYPVKFLYSIALSCVNDPLIGPLDAILSYSNGCIQNTTLFEYYSKFINDCKIKKVLNGSILSMSLLRNQKTHDFHPASSDLKEKVQEIAKKLSENGTDLADLSTRFAIRKWLFDDKLERNLDTSIVLGVSNVEELSIAVNAFNQVKNNQDDVNTKDEELFDFVKKELGSHFNETWASGNFKE